MDEKYSVRPDVKGWLIKLDTTYNLKLVRSFENFPVCPQPFNVTIMGLWLHRRSKKRYVTMHFGSTSPHAGGVYLAHIYSMREGKIFYSSLSWAAEYGLHDDLAFSRGGNLEKWNTLHYLLTNRFLWKKGEGAECPKPRTGLSK